MKEKIIEAVKKSAKKLKAKENKVNNLLGEKQEKTYEYVIKMKSKK